jgi:hypothetical protein
MLPARDVSWGGGGEVAASCRLLVWVRWMIVPHMSSLGPKPTLINTREHASFLPARLNAADSCKFQKYEGKWFKFHDNKRLWIAF